MFAAHRATIHENKSKSRTRRWCAIVGLIISLVAVSGGVAWLREDFGVQKQRVVKRVLPAVAESIDSVMPVTPVETLPLVTRQSPLSGTENILVAGMDRRPGTKGSGLTDTLILVVLEKRTGRVGLISIPRDTAVEVPSHGRERINAVYGLAQAHGDDALAALKQAVGDLLALTIAHAVVIDLAVFEQLVDTLGGVTVDVPCPIVDDFVDSRTSNGRRVLDVKEGSVHMDGATVAMYVRSRHGRSDFSRARRQQSVLNALHRELLTLGSLGRLPDVLSTIEHNVATDLKRYELLALARRALAVRAEYLHAMVIPETAVEPLMDRGRAMLSPKLDDIDASVSKLFSMPAPGAEHQGALCLPADIALRRKPQAAPVASSDPGVLVNAPAS